jgi:hypothetical protein
MLHRLAEQRYRLYTTNVMLIETHALILSVLGHRQAVQFLRESDQGSTTVIRVRQGSGPLVFSAPPCPPPRLNKPAHQTSGPLPASA